MGTNAVLDVVAPFFSDHLMLIIAICGLALFAPLIVFLVYCLRTKPVDTAAHRKKTDEHTPDDRDAKKQKCKLEEEGPSTKEDNTAQKSEDTQEQSTGLRGSNSRVEARATELSTVSNGRIEAEVTEQSTVQSETNGRIEAEPSEQSVTVQSDSNSRIEAEPSEQSVTVQSDSIEAEASEQSTTVQSDSNGRIEAEPSEQSVTVQSDSIEAEASEQSTTVQSETNGRIEAEVTEQSTIEQESEMCESPKDYSLSEHHRIHKKPVPPPVASKMNGRAPVIIKDLVQPEQTRVSPSVPPSGSPQNEDAPSIKEEAVRGNSPAHDTTNSCQVTTLVSDSSTCSNHRKEVHPDIKPVNGLDKSSQLKVPMHSSLSDQRKGDAPTREVVLNGWSHEDGQAEVTKEACQEGSSRRWSFPPILEEFNLMETDVDPEELESYFTDDRLIAIDLTVEPDGLGLGISIVGGSGSPNGDLPIIIKRVLPGSLAEKDGKLKSGDELIAVNDTLLVGMRKDFAINTLSNIEGPIRLLVLQDDD